MLNILNVAQTGLRASQTQVENVMNNLANENTPGYKKRAVDVSEIEHADSRITGRGISIDNVSRATNIYMYQNIIRESAKLSDTQALNGMLGDIESIFFETDTSGLSADLNRYFSSIENLRTGPQNEIYKNDVRNNANSLILDLKTIYESIEEKEKSTLLETKEVVAEVNGILSSIGAISKKILDNTGATPNDLLDKRDHLELELAKYIDVEISREDSYQIKIGGATAVRFDTNVHQLNLIENYIPQKDVYALQRSDGTTIVNSTTRDFESTTRDKFTGFTASTSEIQTMDISGTATEPVVFLGTTVAGSVAGEDANATITRIIADKTNIMDTWNKSHPDQEISDIVDNGGGQLGITYKNLEGDVPAIGNAQSNGIVFTGSLETTKGVRDSITYTLDKKHSVTVTVGETIYKADGTTPADIDGLGNSVVTEDNIIQALVYQINQHKDIGGKITAYNGNYELDKRGNKILTDNPLHSKYQPTVATVTPPSTTAATYIDRYLVIEASVDGEEGSFVGEILINDGNGTSNTRSIVEKNENVSIEATDDIHLEIYDKEITLTGGSLNAMVNNIKTDSGDNLFKKYKEILDNFAKSLSNYTSSYIENDNGTYTYGGEDVSLNANADKGVNIDLFSGATVKTLKFNHESLNIMTQEKLDYLADLQWKEDIDFDGTGLDEQSFSSYFQTLRVIVADDRETVIFNQDSLEAVKESLQSSYDKITKVDKDEEMVNLIKFQSAYESSAKVITVIDQMLQTLLGIKR